MNALTSKPQTREHLRRKAGISDRQMRATIETLRKQGYPICSDSQNGGYWMGSEKDALRMAKSYEHRALCMLDTARKMKLKILDNQSGSTGESQMEMELNQ